MHLDGLGVLTTRNACTARDAKSNTSLDGVLYIVRVARTSVCVCVCVGRWRFHFGSVGIVLEVAQLGWVRGGTGWRRRRTSCNDTIQTRHKRGQVSVDEIKLEKELQ